MEEKLALEVAKKPATTASPSEPLVEVLRRMLQAGTSRAIIIEAGVPSGIVTLRDAARAVVLGLERGYRGVAEALHTKVSLWMTREVISVPESAPLIEAVINMALWNIGGLPIVDSAGRPVRILEELDIMEEVSKTTLPIRAWQVMTTAIWAVKPEEPLKDALKLMVVAGIRHLPIIERGALQGMLSLQQALKAIVESSETFKASAGPLTKPVSSVAEPVETVHPDTLLSDVARCMVNSQATALPVTTDTSPAGIISARDIIRAIASRYVKARIRTRGEM